MYRAVALALRRAGIAPRESSELRRLLESLALTVVDGRVLVNGEDVTDLLHTPELDQASSEAGTRPDVRARLVALQRQIAADAARLQTSPTTVRKYLDWYGEQPVTVVNKRGMKSMPAYEAEIRWQVLGEKFRILRQMELALPVSNQYAYEQRGW